MLQLDMLATVLRAMRHAARSERDAPKRAALARMMRSTRRAIMREAVRCGAVRFVIHR